jgi:hypothetical protein
LPRFSIDDLKRVQAEGMKKLQLVRDPVEGGKMLAGELAELVDPEIRAWANRLAKESMVAGMLLGLEPHLVIEDLFLMGVKLGVDLADGKSDNQMSVNLKFMAH